MRFLIPLGLVTLLIPGCGDDGGDAPPVHPPPRVIAGGGIGDGPIDGVANVYVIDDATRMPVAGATVRVGDVEGTTDAAGLFIAEGVTGPQTVMIKASGYRSELWIGANGTNLTSNVQLAAELTPPRANVSGSVNVGSLVVPAGHTVLAQVGYSQTDDLGATENELATPNNTNFCVTGVGNNQPCTFTVTTRAGKLALFAAVYDRDLKGTPTDFTDDTQTLIGWAIKTGLTVTGGVDQSGQTLELLPGGMLGSVMVDFGAPPLGLNNVAALVGIDVGTDGVLQLPVLLTPTDATLLAPRLTAFAGASYRLTAIATDGTLDTSAQSIVLRRDLAASPLQAGAWLPVATGATATRTGASWTAVPGATVQSVEYAQGTANLLSVTVFDGTTQVTIPDALALPQGPLTAKVNAIGAPGLDVTSFSLDADRDKLSQVSSQPIAIN